MIACASPAPPFCSAPVLISATRHTFFAFSFGALYSVGPEPGPASAGHRRSSHLWLSCNGAIQQLVRSPPIFFKLQLQ